MQDAGYTTIQVGGHRAGSPRYEALVDVADAEAVGAYRWSMSEGYAVRTIRVGSKRLRVRMHREILGLGPDDPDVDHISGNTLNNRRANLRVCTHAENQQNRQDRPDHPYRGVTWDARARRWKAQAQLARKCRYLGCYDTREEAAAVAAAFRRQHMPYSRDARE